MTFSTPSDNNAHPEQAPDHTNFELPQSDTEDTYRDLANTFNQLGVSAAYQDISQLDFNILEVPDLQSLDDPNHTERLDKTGSGKSVLVASKLLEERSQTPSHLKINFHPKPSH